MAKLNYSVTQNFFQFCSKNTKERPKKIIYNILREKFKLWNLIDYEMKNII